MGLKVNIFDIFPLNSENVQINKRNFNTFKINFNNKTKIMLFTVYANINV